MIVITGATGKLGTLIVDRVLQRVSASEVGISVRDPGKAAQLQARGIRVRQGDFAQPAGLEHAFEGVTRLLIVSSNAGAYGGDPIAQHRAAIDAARHAGVQRIIYTSHCGASASSAFPPMWTHAATEAMLADSGVAWTALRNGFYAEAALGFMGREWNQGRIEMPADGKVAWTTHADLAEAAAVVLTGGAVFERATPPLTGAESLDLNDLARLASELLGRRVSREVIDDGAFRQRLVQSGTPETFATMSLGFFAASRRGEFATVDPTLTALIQRDPITMRHVLTEAIAAQR